MDSTKFCFIVGCLAVLLLVGCSTAPQPSTAPAPWGVDLRRQFAEANIAPRQQGQRGSCQVCAFTAVLEFDLARSGQNVDLSEQYLMWAANEACGLTLQEGFNPDRLIRGLQKHGICPEVAYPYVPRKEPIAEASPEARRLAIHGWSRTDVKHWSEDIGFSDSQLSQIEELLELGQPVVATFCWPFGVPDPQITDPDGFLVDAGIDGTSKNGHGVVLVGYQHDATRPGGGYFHFRNSWGSAFADGGYAKIDYTLARKYGTDAYFVRRTKGQSE
jgi:hypothetical protein